MRKFCIGNTQASSNWSPKFKASKTRQRRADKLGSAHTPVMSWFPTIKGEPRMEGLRHYFHKGMAMLLDAAPDVTSWTAQTTPIVFELYGKPVEFTPDFIAVENHRTRAIRLLRAGTTMSEKRQERHSAVAAAYQEAEQRLDVITQEELEADMRLPGARTLFIHRQVDMPDDMPWLLAEAWGPKCPTTLGAIHASLGGDAESWDQLLSLSAMGHLHLDLGAALGTETVVLSCDVQGYRQ
jgi:hypothetical protein